MPPENSNAPGEGASQSPGERVEPGEAPLVAVLRFKLNADGIPPELRAAQNWVCWELAPPKKPGDKFGKIPVNPHTGQYADSTDQRTWGTFEQALACMARTGLPGVGFVFAGNEFVGVDLDHCRDPETGAIEAWAQAIVDKLASYTEISPSGTGLHIIVRGKLPPGRRKKSKIEMYGTARFFTITGARLAGTPFEVAERQTEIDALHQQAFGESKVEPAKPQPLLPVGSNADEWVIKKAGKAKNGKKFQALMAGDTTGYPSQSEATGALLCTLAFWTQRDPVQMDRIFRTSGLMREKWDERRGDSTWGQQEIERASALVTRTARVAPMPYGAANGASTQRIGLRELLIPGDHLTPEGKYEISTVEFATTVLNVIPAGEVYVRGQVPGEITGAPGACFFIPLSSDRARLLIDSHVHLFKWVVKGRTKELVRIYEPCSKDNANLVLACALHHPNARELKSIVRSPAYAGREFERLLPGFNHKHGVFYDEHPSLRGIEAIKDRAQINAILTDLLVDFPFQSDADWENFIGLLLLPLIRSCIRGNLPLHLVLSCMERSGKTKLIELVLGRLLQGLSIPAVTLSENEDEREKRILAILLAGIAIVHLDNQPPYLDSRVLASLLTAETFQGRVLGVSRMASVRNDAIFVASGNNVRASSEMSKRIVPIRLLPKVPHPEQRTDFKHADLPAYLETVRRRVIGALLGMIENWIAAGKPRSKVAFGGFEDFTAIVGGILEVQGYTEWLKNRAEWVGDADLHGGDLETLVEAWKTAQLDWAKPDVIFQLARSLELFPDLIQDRQEHAARSNFGRRVLLAATGRPVLGMRIVVAGKGSSRRYKLVRIEGGVS